MSVIINRNVLKLTVYIHFKWHFHLTGKKIIIITHRLNKLLLTNYVYTTLKKKTLLFTSLVSYNTTKSSCYTTEHGYKSYTKPFNSGKKG